MCPNINKQDGFLIPMAMFIVVGMVALAVAIARMGSASFSAAVLEGISAQALYAAESGAYYAMNQLVFDVNTRSVSDANCTSLNGSSLSFNVSGLNNCTTQISCSVATDSGNTSSYYSIQSAAQCGGGDLRSERTVEVNAVMQ